MKRFTALFLTLAMLLSLFPTTVWAEEQMYTDDQVYVAAEETEGIPEEDLMPTEEPIPSEVESTPAEEESTLVEETLSTEEPEDSEEEETVVMTETITVSSPAANAAATVEARWGLATGTNSDKAPADTAWVKSGTLADAMDFANGLTSDVAYIQLLNDVDTTAPLEFASGTTAVLDLNSYTIDRGLTATKANGTVIEVVGSLTLCDSSARAIGKITGGKASGYGGGVLVDGGTFTMNGGNISGNTSAFYGAGVYVDEGTFTMNGGTIAENKGPVSGGGVYLYKSTFTMNDGAIANNSADVAGGVYVSYECTFVMNGGVISGNKAKDGSGGGVQLYKGTFTMTGGAIVGNTSSEDGGGVYLNDGTFNVSNKVNITNNIGRLGATENVYVSIDSKITVGELAPGTAIGVRMHMLNGTFTIGGEAYANSGYFFSDYVSAYVTADGNGNIKLSTDLATALIRFEANGGSGTMSPQPIPKNALATLRANQFTREGYIFDSWNTATDGSGTKYEDMDTITAAGEKVLYAQWKPIQARWGLAVNGNAPADNAWVGNGTLSEAMSYYRDISSSDTAYIQLLNNVNTNSTGALTFALISPAILDLNGYTIDRGLTAEQYDGYVICVGNPNNDYIFSKLTICDTSTTVVANQGKITGGYCATEGGGIRVCINGSLTMNGGNITDNKARDGGGVYAYGAMVMNGGAISNNTVTWHGGGVYSYCQNGYGSFEMTSGTISGNNAKNGGGLYKNGYDFNMTGGTISNNTASERGGGVYYYGSGSGVFTMSNSIVSGNTANYGGGINVVTGTLDMVSGTITKNTAVSNGGGVGVIPDYAYEAPSFVMQNGTISENTAVRGGGIHVEKGSFTMVNGTITKNTATNSGGGVSSWTNSSFTMDDGIISKNSAINGGGVCNIGTFIMNNGTISDNNASSYGGGAYAAQGSFTMNNGMISENTATHEGGGVYVMWDTFTLNDGTISENSAKDGGGVYLAYIDGTLLFDMKGGSIISNTATNAGGGVYPTGDSTFKISGAANISGNTVGTTENNVYLLSGQVITVGELTSDTSIGVTMLAPSTFTSGGAEYAEDDYFASDNSVYTVAEDGENLKLVENLIGEACWGVASGTNPPRSWVGCGTLEQATEYAAALGSSSKAYIRLLDNVETSSPLVFVAGKNAILDLNGYDIDRKLTGPIENGNVITVNGNLILCDTSATADGKITGGYNTGWGGGVVVSGTLTMNGGSVSGNRANYGGGVDVSGTFTMTGGTISGNTATRGGGGVHVYSGSFELSNGTISGNTASDGGGVYVTYNNWNDLIITGGTISGNTVTGDGGGLWLDHYSFVEISGSPVIFGNTKNGTRNNATGLYELGTSGSESNAYLCTSTNLTVKALTSGANIGIAIEGGEGVFAKPDGTDVTSLSTYTTYFSSDNHASTVVVDGTDLKLVQNEAHWGLAVDGKAPTTWVHGGILADAVSYANDLTSGTAYIQLLSDVSTSAAIVFDKTAILDLNGCDIDRGLSVNGNLTLCDTSAAADGKITGGYGYGVFVWEDGSFTMNGGIISGNESGGVYLVPNGGSFVLNNGTISRNQGPGVICNYPAHFTMNGGTISGNDSGGAWVAGVFNMNGGTITGNNSTSADYGGGVIITLQGRMEVTGDAVITGNMRNGTLNTVSGLYEQGVNGQEENLSLPYVGITVKNLSSTAKIGVTMPDRIGQFAAGDADYTENFFSDNSAFVVVADGNKLKLAYPALTGVSAEGFTGTYDGQPHGITVTAPNGATVKYGITEGTYDKDASPTITKAGTLTVYYQVTKDGYSAVTGSAQVIISKATPTVTVPEAQNSITYGAKLSTVGLTDGWTWVDGTVVPTVTNSGYVAYYTPADTTNYDWTDIDGWSTTNNRVERTVEVTVAQKEIGISWGSTSFTYNGSDQAPTATATGMVNGDEVTLTVTGEQTNASAEAYTATVTGIVGDKAGNYELPEVVTTQFTIAKAEIAKPAKEEKQFVYNGELQTYSVADSELYTVSNNTRTAAGTQKVTIVLTDKDNYAWVGGSSDDLQYTFTVLRKAVIVTADAKTKVYGDADPVFTYTASGLVAGETLVGELSREEGNDVGTYAITQGTVTWENNPNYGIAFVGATLTIEKNTYTVSGGITSYLDDTADITIELFAEGSTEADYTATVKGNSATYSIEGVTAGIYTMKVSKVGHVTCEYMVEITDADVTQDAKIYPKGDVNLDGVVNSDDLTALARHVAKIETLTDPQALLCSSLDDDGDIDSDDLTKLARYVAKIITEL